MLALFLLQIFLKDILKQTIKDKYKTMERWKNGSSKSLNKQHNAISENM